MGTGASTDTTTTNYAYDEMGNVINANGSTYTYDKYEVNPRAEAISQLSMVFYYPQDWTPPADAYPATVRLYDADGKLIIEKSMQLFEQIQK